MSDSDRNSPAWCVTPSEYVARRDAASAAPAAPFSRYLTMRDGCRIAVDVWLPQAPADAPPIGPVPTILILR